jgi:aryl-alcohol dehydrogenase-like predicted oxidoreductase
MLAAGTAALAAHAGASQEPVPRIARRPLGRMGFEASIYALGTAEVPALEETVEAIDLALDHGVNYVDTAPSYQERRAEQAVGVVAKRRRKDFFLATKTLARDADGAFAEVRESLARLQCETIDLLQVHAVNDEATLARVLGKGGALEGLDKARREGLIRHIGITGHTRPAVIAKALDEYPFESILVPISAADHHLHDFAGDVVPKAVERGLAVAGMKSLKGVENHAGKVEDAAPFVRYALSAPISTLTIGFRRISDVRANLEIARSFTPMAAEQRAELERSVASWASADVLWWKRQA